MRHDNPAASTNAGMEAETQQILHFLRLIASADGPEGVLAAVRSYLNAWTSERIARVREVDGGQGPFDSDLRVVPLSTLGNLSRLRDRVRDRCFAFKQAGIQSTPELVELDEILSLATRFAESTKTPEFKARSATLGKRSALLNFL